jgi:hypothetical protein
MLRLLLLLSCCLAATSCADLKPQGNLKHLSDGTLFSTHNTAPVPADNRAIPSRDETDVSWRIGL